MAENPYTLFLLKGNKVKVCKCFHFEKKLIIQFDINQTHVLWRCATWLSILENGSFTCF